MRALAEWPRPNPDSGLGLHLGASIYDTRHRDLAMLEADHRLWQQMGIRWLKVFASGDSQLVSVKRYCDLGYEVILRLYSAGGPEILDRSWPVEDMQPYVQAGVHYIEAFNEPEAELRLGEWPTQETIDRLAAAYVRFADAAAHAGAIPCTPAFQGDRTETWLRPFLRAVKAIGRQDALEGSAIAGHWRPANHPPTHPPPGFVIRSYEVWAEIVQAEIGGLPPFLGTEAGYEPGDDQDKTMPKITLGLHADYNVAQAQMEWPPYLFCQCWWLWQGPWGGSSWIENPIWREEHGAPGGVLPVVKVFCEMPKVQRWPVGEPLEPEAEWSEAEASERIRERCWNALYPAGGIARNPLAAFQRETLNLGAPVTHELRAGGWVFQGFVVAILACREGEWDKVRRLSWTGGV